MTLTAPRLPATSLTLLVQVARDSGEAGRARPDRVRTRSCGSRLSYEQPEILLRMLVGKRLRASARRTRPGAPASTVGGGGEPRRPANHPDVPLGSPGSPSRTRSPPGCSPPPTCPRSGGRKIAETVRRHLQQGPKTVAAQPHRRCHHAPADQPGQATNRDPLAHPRHRRDRRPPRRPPPAPPNAAHAACGDGDPPTRDHPELVPTLRRHLLFTTKNGTPVEPRNVNRPFGTLCRRADVRSIRLHDLRHSCATLLFAMGVDVIEQVQHAAVSGTDSLLSPAR